MEFDDNGYLTQVEYAGFGNMRVPDGQGIFGRRYVHDKEGRVIEEHYLGKNGSPKSTQFGLGKKKFKYDDNGNLIRIQYLTVDDKPSSDGNNCPVVDLTYDKWGNRTSERYFDLDGNPMLRKDNSVAGFIYEYNDKGQCVKYLFLGIDGGLTYMNGASGYVLEYDENGYRNKQTFIDTEGKMALFNSDGIVCASVETVNNKKGNVTDLKILDPSGKLIDTSSYSRVLNTYDSIGNLLTEIYVDEKGNMCKPPKLGYAGMQFQYNPQGRLQRLTYLDESKQAMTLPDLHYCYYTIDYDVRGNVSKISYYDKDGKPVITNEGISSAVREYDENGNEKSRQFFDEKGKPCVLNWFCSKIEKEYDDQGNETVTRYLDTEGKPMSVNGVATYEYEYDERGNITKERPLGTNGQIAQGQYEHRVKYDGLDNVVESSYFNNAGTPVVCEDGYHREVRKYNSRNQCTDVEFYGVNGKLVNVGNNKCAVIKREYDARGNKISETFFNSDGKRGTDNLNVHKYFNQYDKLTNQICHQISFGADGKPIVANNIGAEAKVEYDKRGNMVKLQCYDGYGKKENGRNGWHETRFEYNNAGENTGESYFNLEGKPVEDALRGYHKTTTTYNSMRMPESQSFYDSNGKLKNIGAGYATIKMKYNSQNQRTEISYYGVTGKPVDCNGGWHREVYSYKNGKEIRCDLFTKTNQKYATANKINGQWIFNNSNVSGFQNNREWKSIWLESAEECPQELDNGIIIEYIEVDKNKVTIYMCISGFSTDMDIEEFKKQLADTLRELTNTPSYVDIVIINSENSNNSNVII